jgi:hypothetical protein
MCAVSERRSEALLRFSRAGRISARDPFSRSGLYCAASETRFGATKQERFAKAAVAGPLWISKVATIYLFTNFS